MIKKIEQNVDKKKAGAKGAMLSQLTRQGFSVPKGIIVEQSVYEKTIKENGIDQQLRQQLEQLSAANIEEISRTIQQQLQLIHFSTSFIDELEQFLDEQTAYAVRSSGIKEDLEAASFAGQYESFLEIQGVEAVLASIKACYQSMFSVENLSYLLNREMAASELSMAVIIQEYIAADYSGVAFTLDPVTGNDQTLVLEIAAGRGDQLVGGFVTATAYRYDWKMKEWLTGPEEPTERMQLEACITRFLAVQRWLGYPCDIEFALKEGQLHFLQVRPITSYSFEGIHGQWTTANFQDGGVSSEVCTPFMWSLYHSVWDLALGDFLVTGKIFKQEDFSNLLRFSYGRPYWNVGVVKQAMAKFPGYVEKDFDNELGIKISYSGAGQKTGLQLGLLWPIIRMAIAQKGKVSRCLKEAPKKRKQLLKAYNDFREKLEIQDEAELFNTWKKLVEETYIFSEVTYFQQVYLNTVQQTLFKDQMLKYLNYQEYLLLLGGLSEISHTLPYQSMWTISREILADAAILEYWQQESAEEIAADLQKDGDFPGKNRVTEYLLTFGYHSERELNIAYPSYEEQPLPVVQQIQNLLQLDEAFSPKTTNQQQYQAYLSIKEKLTQKVSAGKMKRLTKKITQIRTLLWWREEFKDFSTRYYALIRQYTLKLAESLTVKGILQQPEDIWYLRTEEIIRFLDGKISEEELQDYLEIGRSYYLSFRQFQPAGDIGSVYQKEAHEEKQLDRDGLAGVGCNQGIVTGRARVIKDTASMNQLQIGEILVTRFTDTGWTSKFAILKGIVTETGGVLCHAAICAREYGVPCIVCAKEATQKIETGMLLEINGGTGEIRILDN
ncbi:PEP/pyruvate-binding domain-containing protein [Enterococcus sp. LJL128]